MASVNGGVWGTIVAFERVGKKGASDTAEEGDENGGRKGAAKYIVDVLVNTQGDGPLAMALSSTGAATGGQRLALLSPQAKRLEPQVVALPLSQVRQHRASGNSLFVLLFHFCWGTDSRA